MKSTSYIFGGEERFWLGPEGGQYALFFKPGSKSEFSDSGTKFNVGIERTLKLLGKQDASKKAAF